MLAGDWHGQISWAVACIQRAGAREVPVIVQLGDFGFWTASPAADRYIGSVNKTLAEHDISLLWLDGNHEDHSRLASLPVDPDTGLRKITNNIWHLPRGFRWTWHGATWMAVGGAHSVDRQHRREGYNWWPGEHLTAEDVEYASRPGPVDVIVAHDAPLGVTVPGLGGPNPWPVAEIEAAQQHRALLRRVVDQVHPAALIHGHYHQRYDTTLELPGGGTCEVQGLAHDGSPGNLVILDAEQLHTITAATREERAARRGQAQSLT